METMELQLKSIFRAYDIRGIYNEILTDEIAYKIGRAFATLARENGESKICVASDARLSSPELRHAVIKGLTKSGCNVIHIDTLPTPLLYYATFKTAASSGVMITGSHNPAGYNGMKLVLQRNTLKQNDITNLYKKVVQEAFLDGDGSVIHKDISHVYLEEIADNVRLAKSLKVVVDCGNGIAGNIVPQLFRLLGCQVVELFCEVDGNFPNHHPDPSDPKNLQNLVETVKKEKADIGFAFDGDGDRLGVVTNRGNIIWPDRQMMLFAKSVLQENHGAKIIFDVKCSRYLPEIIEKLGGEPIMWKTGHSLIKAKLFETDAKLAGEMSGHIFFNDRWYGFDDALYSAARLLEILSYEKQDADAIFAQLPNSVNTPELRLNMSEQKKFEFMQKFADTADFPEASDVSTIDGMRVDFEDGWGLMRVSNTTPCVVLRFEAESEKALQKIKNKFRKRIKAIDEELEIPF
ncbi:MAG: phosphomannomutase/phosphoglucomutase [Pseudomonadota bacterium]